MTTMQHADASIEHAPAAWRRPGVVFVLYAYRLVVALLAATPIAMVLGSSVGGYPRADALYFDDGGLMLAEALRRAGPLMGPIVTSSFVLLAVASFASIVPLAALIGALSMKGKLTARDVGAFALRPVGTFALLFGAFAVVQALVFAIVSAIFGAISRRPAFDAPTADRVKIIGAILALLLVAVLGVWHDLARVAVVRDELRFRAALRRGWTTLKKFHARVFGAWALRALLGAVVLYAAFSIGSRLGVDSSAKVFFGFLVYQASVVLALFLKASWFASAIRHVDRSRPVIVAEPAPEPVVAPVAPEVHEAPAAPAPEEPSTNGDDVSAETEQLLAKNPAVSDNLDAQA